MMLNIATAVLMFFISIYAIKKIFLLKDVYYAFKEAELKYMKSPTPKNKLNMILALQRRDEEERKLFNQNK